MWILIGVAILVVALYINFSDKALKYLRLENEANSKEVHSTGFICSYVAGNILCQGKIII